MKIKTELIHLCYYPINKLCLVVILNKYEVAGTENSSLEKMRNLEGGISTSNLGLTVKYCEHEIKYETKKLMTAVLSLVVSVNEVESFNYSQYSATSEIYS